MLRNSSGESFSSGITRFVISNQTSVSCFSQRSVSEHRLQVRSTSA